MSSWTAPGLVLHRTSWLAGKSIPSMGAARARCRVPGRKALVDGRSEHGGGRGHGGQNRTSPYRPALSAPTNSGEHRRPLRTCHAGSRLRKHRNASLMSRSERTADGRHWQGNWIFGYRAQNAAVMGPRLRSTSTPSDGNCHHFRHHHWPPWTRKRPYVGNRESRIDWHEGGEFLRIGNRRMLPPASDARIKPNTIVLRIPLIAGSQPHALAPTLAPYV